MRGGRDSALGYAQKEKSSVKSLLTHNGSHLMSDLTAAYFRVSGTVGLKKKKKLLINSYIVYVKIISYFDFCTEFPSSLH